MGLQVPHGHCCVLEKTRLLSLVSESELGASAKGLAESVILVARSEDADPGVQRREEWRLAFHGHVHHHLESRARDGALGDAVVRQRIHRIGQTEFDEIRAVLRAEELLFAARDDRETLIEFAAFYLELRHFVPDEVARFFPTLRDLGTVDATLALDVDADVLLSRSRPEGAEDLPEHRAVSTHPPPGPGEAAPAPSEDAVRVSRVSAEGARKVGNVVRSAIERLRAKESADEDLLALGRRIELALDVSSPAEPAPTAADWARALAPLAEAAARSASPRPLPARVLFDIQKACVDSERARRTVDVVTWVTSLFRRPIVRPLPAVRTVRVARHLRHAFATSHAASLSKPDRERLEHVFHQGLARAEANVRRTVVPALETVLSDVGLAPASVPERVAREKLCEEIVDAVLERGFVGIGQLRDALSRSNLKMSRLAGPGELLFGDALLKADDRLAVALDGVYRPGEIYLRFLQKASSVAFGTGIGRLVTLHLVLPALAAFVLLEGLSHVAHPIGKALGHPHVHLLTPWSFGALALYFYGLIHAAPVRDASLAVVRFVGSVLSTVLFGIPRWLFTRPFVVAVLQSRAFSLIGKPLLLGAPVFFLLRRRLGLETAAGVALGLVLATVLVLATPLGARMEEGISDAIVRAGRLLSRRVLPGLFAFLVDLFKMLVERVDRGIYTVDEWLTFKQGQSRLALVAKGVLGTIWFFTTYVLRLYVNVLVEPQVNPIKHFPVVTVSHKIILPLSPTILEVFRQPLLPLGPVVANGVAGTTVFLLPGMFGFLVWELKENWKLYAHNRSATLGPVIVGHHGETMRGLLVPGFHSGTVPKLYGKLRRATRRGSHAANAHREVIHQVEHAVTAFFEREIVGLLSASRRWTAGEVAIQAVEMGSNRIRVAVACPSVSDQPAWIHFEEQSGWLVAGVASRGFLDELDDVQRETMNVALAGLYKLAGVEIVREQVEALLGKGTPYDVADEGLVVWPGDGYESEVVYDLEGRGSLSPTVRGKPLASAPASLSADDLVFARQKLAWADWVRAWKGPEACGPVIAGPPMLLSLTGRQREGGAFPCRPALASCSDLAVRARDEPSRDRLRAGVLEVVRAHVDGGSDVVQPVVADVDVVADRLEDAVLAEPLVRRELGQVARARLDVPLDQPLLIADATRQELRDLLEEARAPEVLLGRAVDAVHDLLQEVRAQRQEAVEGEPRGDAHDVLLAVVDEGAGEVADAVTGDAVHETECGELAGELDARVDGLRRVRLGRDAVEKGQEREFVAELVGERRCAAELVHAVDAGEEPDRALVALLGIVVERVRPLADRLDEGLVVLARDVVDEALEAGDVRPLSRHHVVQRAEQRDREAVLRKLFDQAVDRFLAHWDSSFSFG